MDPDQTAPNDLGLHCLLKRLLKHFSRRQKQTTFVVIGVLRVNSNAPFICKLGDAGAFSSSLPSRLPVK